MYLKFFEMHELPFTLAPNIDYFCDLPGHHTALNVLLVSLRSGEGFVKTIGEVGTGKTLLCRKLLNCLDENFVTAYIPTPDLTPDDLRRTLARELGLKPRRNMDQHELFTLISKKLITLKAAGKPVVLLLDEAQSLPNESLEALRLLTNLETETSKLLQVVLFAQPELDYRLNKRDLRQLRQRITNSYQLQPLTRTDVGIYLHHRLTIAGAQEPTQLFSKQAVDMLYRSSRGIPRLINIIAHKALMAAYGRGKSKVRRPEMKQAIRDTEDVTKPSLLNRRSLAYGIALLVGTFIALKLRIIAGVQ